MGLELVKWRDAHFYQDAPERTREDFIVRTVGWVREGERFLCIVSERTPEGNRAVTYVPNENIIERRKLT